MDYIRDSRKIGVYALVTGTFFICSCALSQSPEQLKKIQSYNQQEELQTLIQTFKKQNTQQRSRLLVAAKSRQWEKNQKQQDGTIVSLNEIGEDGTLLYYTTHRDPTSKVSRANTLYTGGTLDLDLSGKGLKVGVWDAGAALTTHQEYDARVMNSDGSSTIDNHATLVTGTIVSSGVREKAKGVAFAASAITHDWSRDKIEVAEAAASGLLLSNHSYGIKTDRVPDWYFGAYIKVSQDWDKIMYNAPYYLMVTAAGNAQNSHDNSGPFYGKTQDGFDLLLGFTTSKNGMVVAGADTKINSDGLLTTARVSGYSSFGPTDDGRIKPDIAGDGTSVFSTTALSDTSYTSSLGTSMAAPGVTGALLLLQEYYQELYHAFMRSATLKGLALHTADDVQESGPDYKMGWGVINTKKAAETIRNKDFTAMIEERTLAQGETYSFTVEANGQTPFSASISWTDPEGQLVNRGELNANLTTLVNDLDIRVVKNGKKHYPWKLDPNAAENTAHTGDNTVDPFERIDLTEAEGTYTITVSHKGDLYNGTQDFSLILTGAALTNCRLEVPETLELVTAEEQKVKLEWSSVSDDNLYEVQYKNESHGTWLTTTTWENSLWLDTLEVGEDYRVRIRSACSPHLVSDFSEELRFTFNGMETVAQEQTTMSITKNTIYVRVSPNPVVNELHIDAQMTNEAEYAIITTSGTTIKSGNANAGIDVSELASGLYILMIKDYEGLRTAKFFKR
ncbi:MAG: S8 family serine peptidase [Bacteroidota bacterium]